MARLDARKSILVARNAKIDSLRSVPGAGLAALGLLVTFRLFDTVISRLERACKDFRNLWNALPQVSQGRAPNFQHQNRHGRLRLLVSQSVIQTLVEQGFHPRSPANTRRARRRAATACSRRTVGIASKKSAKDCPSAR